jgi:hypothetical protein
MTFDDLKHALRHYVSQTNHEVQFATGTLDDDTLSSAARADVREMPPFFRERHEAAQAALAELEALASRVLTELLHTWGTNRNPALHAIAHDYQNTGTLAF